MWHKSLLIIIPPTDHIKQNICTHLHATIEPAVTVTVGEENAVRDVGYKPAVKAMYIEAAPAKAFKGTTKPAVEHRLALEQQ